MMRSLNTVSPTAIPPIDAVPASVRDFAVKHGLVARLEEMLALVGELFDISGTVSLGIEEDPDIAERWIEIGVAARGKLEDVMRSHDEYTERLLTLPGERSREIRLFLHIAENQ